MFEIATAKETLMSDDVPDRPWQKVGIDLLTHKSIDYVITVDYFSNFWEIDKLNHTTSNAVITKNQSTLFKIRHTNYCYDGQWASVHSRGVP